MSRKRSPSFERRSPSIRPYVFSLDGGGREMVVDMLRDRNARTMVEVGVFLGGSTRQWLESKKDLTVIGVDPWAMDAAATLERYLAASYADKVFAQIDDRQEFIDSVRRNGVYESCLANLAEFGNRFVPVRGYSPEALHELKRSGVEPDVIYIDSIKHGEDLDVSHDLWPNAILCGDDWTWGAEQGFPMRTAVESFCQRHGYNVRADRATWMVDF